jgi:hypothetical protein
MTVTHELHDAILIRDGICVAALLDRGHVCRDEWGQPHAPTDLYRLTVEHVKDEPRMGKRAPSDESHMMALCFGANAWDHWGSRNRDLCRAYLAGAVRRVA